MGTDRLQLARFTFTFTSILPTPEQERNVNLETKDVSAHYLASLWLLGMKVTATNLTWRDGNLSDTLNNLLMQKLKALSVSLGGREESRAAYNGSDIHKTGICPSAEGHQTTCRHQGIDMFSFMVRFSSFTLY